MSFINKYHSKTNDYDDLQFENTEKECSDDNKSIDKGKAYDAIEKIVFFVHLFFIICIILSLIDIISGDFYFFKYGQTVYKVIIIISYSVIFTELLVLIFRLIKRIKRK